MASKGNNPSSIIYFKDKYFQDIEALDINENTPLHLACEQGSEESVVFLLSMGANPNAQDKIGRTPLFICVNGFRVKIAKKLLQRGADPNIKDFKFKLSAKEKAEKDNLSQEMINVFKKKNICEILFFRPDINKNKCNKSNMFLFLGLNCFIFSSVVLILLPEIFDKIYAYFYIGIMLLMFILYFTLSFSNPGIIKNLTVIKPLFIVEKGEDISNYCSYCWVKKSFNSKHCLICGVCVNGFDHHCFWINNCVGNNNYNLFITFLIYVNLNIFLNVGLNGFSKNIFLFLVMYKLFFGYESFKKHSFPFYIQNLNNLLLRKIIAIINVIICILFVYPIT